MPAASFSSVPSARESATSTFIGDRRSSSSVVTHPSPSHLASTSPTSRLWRTPALTRAPSPPPPPSCCRTSNLGFRSSPSPSSVVARQIRSISGRHETSAFTPLYRPRSSPPQIHQPPPSPARQPSPRRPSFPLLLLAVIIPPEASPSLHPISQVGQTRFASPRPSILPPDLITSPAHNSISLTTARHYLLPDLPFPYCRHNQSPPRHHSPTSTRLGRLQFWPVSALHNHRRFRPTTLSSPHPEPCLSAAISRSAIHQPTAPPQSDHHPNHATQVRPAHPLPLVDYLTGYSH